MSSIADIKAFWNNTPNNIVVTHGGTERLADVDILDLCNVIEELRQLSPQQLEQKIEALSQENRALRDRLQRAEKDLGRARAGNALLVEEVVVLSDTCKRFAQEK